MALVFFSTIIFGALMPFAIKLFRSFDPPVQDLDLANNKSTDGHGCEHNADHHDHLEDDLNKNFNLSFDHPNFKRE
jgi:hypothetical protein